MRDLVCLSHLRWGFVFQRPNHLMSRFARKRRVFFIEEPQHDLGPTDGPFIETFRQNVQSGEGSLEVVVAHLPSGLEDWETARALGWLFSDFFARREIEDPVLWFYTPMALEFARHLPASAVVYDCMDELSLFHGAHEALRENERELLERAQLVFTGGQSLWEAKRRLHGNVHCFPSSVDSTHFGAARSSLPQPSDQAALLHPRVGFFGVLDERLDRVLLDRIAALRPDLSFVLVGPCVKIDPAALPQRPNIHYLGQKTYDELPAYIAGWNVAMMPFARNDATRFISPTKTLEYLAAGRHVVSTSIRDVVRPYGERNLVAIADEPQAFARAIDAALTHGDDGEWLGRVDAMLATTSWDRTAKEMTDLLERVSRSEKRVA
jgi:UDP-galactopyranose mutase